MRVHYVNDTTTEREFNDWSPLGPVAYDIEATGLDVYAEGWRLRVLSLGDTEDAWVFTEESHPVYLARAVDRMIASRWPLLAHNAPYDIAGLSRWYQSEDIWSELFARTIDTRTLSHLIDPAAEHDLKTASTVIAPDAKDSQKELHKVFNQELGFKMEDIKKHGKGWAEIPYDHPTYIHYAGHDVILTARLYSWQAPQITEFGMWPLYDFESEVARVCADMQRRGIPIDVDRAREVSNELEARAAKGHETAALFGIANVNSPGQVSSELERMGAHLVDKTKTGNWKVDKAVLNALIELHEGTDIAELAQAVQDAKQGDKWRNSYVDAVLSMMSPDGRSHPFISSLEARTARMSVSRPPLHQLPSSDALVRSIFRGNEGDLFFSVDYAQIEMKVLAVLAEEDAMIAAIAAGLDLHSATAESIWGADFQPKHRKIAKSVGFGKVYGGGKTTIARQTGITTAEAASAIASYDKTYPGLKRYANYLQRRAMLPGNDGAVITPSGRRLPLDRNRVYAATNYMVQSTARDILAQALLDLEAAGLLPYLYLPIHDEVIGSAPADIAYDVATQVAEVMAYDFGPLHLETEAEVGGANWGTLYLPNGVQYSVKR